MSWQADKERRCGNEDGEEVNSQTNQWKKDWVQSDSVVTTDNMKLTLTVIVSVYQSNTLVQTNDICLSHI